MAQIGLLAPEMRVELIEGEIIDMAPIGHRHTGIISVLHGRFARELVGHVCVWNQGTLRLTGFSAPQPDLILLKHRQDEYTLSPPSVNDVLLIVEVMTPGIHYFHSPAAEGYEFTSSTPAPGRVSLNRLPDLSVDLTGLLDNLG